MRLISRNSLLGFEKDREGVGAVTESIPRRPKKRPAARASPSEGDHAVNYGVDADVVLMEEG